MAVNDIKKQHNPLFHIVRKKNVPAWKQWVVRISAIVIALIVCSVLSAIMIGTSPLKFFSIIIDGTFGTSRRIWKLLKNVAVLLGISLALVPAFKMRFWNIGAEGQVLIGALGAVACVYYFGSSLSNEILLLVMFVAAVVVGMLWAFIPAIFKALFGTNETLFTLMMNYVATYFVSFCLIEWTPNGSSTLGELKSGYLPTVVNEYLLLIIIVLVIMFAMYIYLNYSKQGYEISVVGQSVNTAKYVGINVKKVIIRTMCISGAVCGVVGFLLVSGLDHSITINSVGGQGFTAIMVAWMAEFNPILMTASSFLIKFLEQGVDQISTVCKISDAFPDIVIAVVLFFVIGCEFFIRFKIVFRHKEAKE